jgi:hypothetical protein
MLWFSVLQFPSCPSSSSLPPHLSLSDSNPYRLEKFGISWRNSLRFLWRDVIFQDPRLEAEGEERLLISSPPLPLHYASQTRGFYHREFCIRLINLSIKGRIIIRYQTRINRSTINIYLRHYVISTACLIMSLQPPNWDQWVQKPPVVKLKFMVIWYCQVSISPYPELGNVAAVYSYTIKLHFTVSSLLHELLSWVGNTANPIIYALLCREFLYFIHHMFCVTYSDGRLRIKICYYSNSY